MAYPALPSLDRTSVSKNLFREVSSSSNIDIEEKKESLSEEGTYTQWEEFLEEMGCEVEDYINDIDVLQNKGSSSDSIILFGETNVPNISKRKVAFKIVFKPLSEFDNSLVIEQQIYTNVVNSMLNNFHSPHLTRCVGVVKMCDIKGIESSLPAVQLSKFKIAKNSIEYQRFHMNEASILILEKSSGKTLHDYITGGKLDTNSLFNILFQVFYTLRCFEKVGLSHNDLHAKNIFIDELETPEKRVYYISDDVWVEILVKYDIKIFDFDRSSIYHPSVDRNFGIDDFYCGNFDQCNGYRSRNDLSAIFSYFIISVKDVPVRTFLKSLIDEKFFLHLYERPFLQLNTVNVNGKIKPGDPITDKEIRSIAVCLDKLIKCPEFINNNGRGNSSGIIFTLPNAIKETKWNPTSNKTHKSAQYQLDNHPVSNYLSDEFVTKLYNEIYRYIKSGNIYEKEFGRDYFDKATKDLFKAFITRKNVLNTIHFAYIIACYICCIPFTYKFDEREYISFLNMEIIGSKSALDPNSIVKLISDIWNVFNGVLPVEMIRV